MTAPTPEQMRALADRLKRRQAQIGLDVEAEAALRAAAEQLEAIRNLLQECSDWEPGRRPLEWSINDHYFVDTEFWRRLTGILDPDTGQDAEDD